MTSNFEYYRIFYYVAKYGNLTRAASALNTSQPAVTRTIHKLMIWGAGYLSAARWGWS
ncbi:MAG: LysR family transcriptional regulator [Clostridium sp.]